MQRVRLGDTSSHGGKMVTASLNVLVNGIPCCRVGDLHACPKHGVSPIVVGATTVFANGLSDAVVGSITGCGAVIIRGSLDTFAEL